MRLINPWRPQLGKVSEQILSKYLYQLREKTGLIQFKNSDSVVSWFKTIPDKKKCSFIVLDVVEYYPSITEELLREAPAIHAILSSWKTTLLVQTGPLHAYRSEMKSELEWILLLCCSRCRG